jgi:hypothetical protein
MTSVSELLHAIELVDNALALIDIALNGNPTPDEERSLRRQLLRLEAERRVLEAELDALLDDDDAQGPDPQQLAAIVALSEKVEQATLNRVAASSAIALVSRTLTLIVDVIKA